MVNYNCPRCGYETNIRTKYVNHLRRKFICENTISNDNLQSEFKKYDISEKIIVTESYAKYPENHAKYPENHAKYPEKTANLCSTNVIPNVNKSNPSDKFMSTICKQNVNKTDVSVNEMSTNVNTNNVCEFCNKEFSSRQGKWKHLKTCKEKKKDDEDKANLLNLVDMLNMQLQEQREQLQEQREQNKEQRVEFQKQLSEQNNQIKELIKKAGVNIGTQNIQNNIKILAYKNTDLSHLTDQDYLQCLNRSNMVIPNLIKKIHFNPKKPENHNIYISNIKNKYVMIYDGGKWNLHNQDDTIDDLIDTNEVVIEQKLEEWLENGREYPEIMKKFNRYLEKKEKDAVINKVKEEIKLILFNNRVFANNKEVEIK